MRLSCGSLLCFGEAGPKAAATPLSYSGHSSTPSSSLTSRSSRSSPHCWFITHSWRGCAAARIRLFLRQSGASVRLPSLSQKRTLASVALMGGGFQAGLESLLQLSLSQRLAEHGGRLLGSHLCRSRFPAHHGRGRFFRGLEADVDPVPGCVLVG